MIVIARDNPETKPSIVASIKDAAQNETDIETRTVLVDALLDLTDPDLYVCLKISLDAGFITKNFFDADFLNYTYTDMFYPAYGDERDPLYIFSYHEDHPYRYASDDNLAKLQPFLSNMPDGRPHEYADDGDDNGGGWAEPHAVLKIGRNEPCPCGSGKNTKNAACP